MHKQEASILFRALSNPNSVKVAKMLYNKGNLSNNELKLIMNIDEKSYNLALKELSDVNLIFVNEMVELNKPLLEQLLSFITTPCGCMKK